MHISHFLLLLVSHKINFFQLFVTNITTKQNRECAMTNSQHIIALPTNFRWQGFTFCWSKHTTSMVLSCLFIAGQITTYESSNMRSDIINTHIHVIACSQARDNANSSKLDAYSRWRLLRCLNVRVQKSQIEIIEKALKGDCQSWNYFEELRVQSPGIVDTRSLYHPS